MVTSFLSARGDSIKESHRDLYFMRYIKFVRSSPRSTLTFVHAQVRASKKIALNYFVDISLHGDGSIEESQCECAVGSGPHATCKHVVMVLLGLVDHSSNGAIRTYVSSTQKLQSFHAARPHTGSPIKAQNLPLQRDKTSKWTSDPRPAECRGDATYPHYFRNVVLGAKGACSMPISQLFPPANIRAVAADHTYSSTSIEDMFLEAEGLLNLTARDRKLIEEKTRSQSRSSLWTGERAMRLTASNFGRICKVSVKNRDSLPKALIAPADLSHVPAIAHGRQFEGAALQHLEASLGVKVLKSGLQVHPALPYLAASPDGLVWEENQLCVVETKCPFSCKDTDISCDKLPYLLDSSEGLKLKECHNYFYQVQGQMACTGAKKCYFAVFTHKDFKSLVVPRDEEFIRQMLKDLQAFFEEHFKPFCIQKFLYRE